LSDAKNIDHLIVKILQVNDGNAPESKTGFCFENLENLHYSCDKYSFIERAVADKIGDKTFSLSLSEYGSESRNWIYLY
jgi:hypothetical protein